MYSCICVCLGACQHLYVYSTLSIYILYTFAHRAEHGTAANSGGRSAGGKLSIRRRRKGPRQE